ncbi:MAG: hypothetical protein IPL35_07125, partial [Sphingobacteriales bacterium]|nr:hypothetical protein [Sphingobacteriales bacterium]
YRFIFNDAEVKLAFVNDEQLYQKVNPLKMMSLLWVVFYSFEKIDNVKHWTEIQSMGMNLTLP